MADTLMVKVRDRSRREDCSYKNEVNINDANLIALVLMDLISQFNAPVLKACSIVLNKYRTFPI